jgi:hypothetical protein
MNAQNMCVQIPFTIHFRNFHCTSRELNEYLDFLVSLAALNGNDDRFKEVIRLI